MIKIIVLEGTKHKMGIEYGTALKNELEEVYLILEDFYLRELNCSKEKIISLAESFYNKFPYGYQKFIEGIAEGSQIALDKIKIINAMEPIFGQVVDRSKPQGCSFVCIPDENGNNHLIGRNYDYSPPFNEIAKFLTITVIKETDLVPTCFIAFAGQAYAPTCFNENSLFLALNNGMPSGGFTVQNDRKTILISLLEAMKNSKDLAQLENFLTAINSDYSLIINIADLKNIRSFEYSSSLGNKIHYPEINKTFASTNFFLSKEWDLEHCDSKTWMGVSRRNNLLPLKAEKDVFENLKDLLDKDVGQSGAALKNTIYQIIYDFKEKKLHLRTPKYNAKWHEYSLKELFL